MTTAQGSAIKKYVIVYFCLLVVMAVQFLLGYQKIEGGQLVVRMLTFGAIDTFLVVLIFMNLSSEKRIFLVFIAATMVFVLATMNYIWTDSFRILLYRVTGMGPS